MKEWSNLACAIYVWDISNWVSVDNEDDVTIYYDRNLITDNLERLHYKKELVNNLTDDAKYLVSIILDTPDEFIGCICGSDGIPKKGRLLAFLNVSGWKRSKINKAFNEVNRFVQEYYGR